MARYFKKGEENRNAKLTPEEVDWIYETFPHNRPTQKQAAKRLGIAVNTLQRIINGELWRHRHPAYKHLYKDS